VLDDDWLAEGVSGTTPSNLRADTLLHGGLHPKGRKLSTLGQSILTPFRVLERSADMAALLPVVAIPARDEEALLPRLIAALGRQRIGLECHCPGMDGGATGPLPLEVVIVLNNTEDGSKAAVEAAALQAPWLRIRLEEVRYPPEHAHVGSARRRAMQIAADLQPAGVILTTDADAVPADDWIAANLRAIAAGADLVGGRIIGDPEEEALLGPGFLRRAALHARYSALCDELASVLDPLPHDPWPRHQDHTGASLAVRATVHAAVGGLDPLPFREDLAFVSKVRAAGYRLAHPVDVEVTVSARTVGRAPGGMADCLKTWLRDEAAGVPVRVECPSAVEARLRRRKAIRELARTWTVPAPFSAAALVERFASDDPDAPAAAEAEPALAGLEAMIAEARRRPDAA
jgi:Glycosyl transferase family 2